MLFATDVTPVFSPIFFHPPSAHPSPVAKETALSLNMFSLLNLLIVALFIMLLLIYQPIYSYDNSLI